MITVNDDIIKLYGSLENKLRHDARENTFDYIESVISNEHDYIEHRVAFTDFIDQNIIINMLLKLLPNIDEIEQIKEEIMQEPISSDIGIRIKKKIDDLVVDSPEIIDEQARQNIDNIIVLIDSLFTITQQHQEDIKILYDFRDAVSSRLDDDNWRIYELGQQINTLNEQISKNIKEAEDSKTKIDLLKNKISDLNNTIEKLKNDLYNSEQEKDNIDKDNDSLKQALEEWQKIAADLSSKLRQKNTQRTNRFCCDDIFRVSNMERCYGLA